MTRHYDDEPDESALYNAEVEARRARNMHDAEVEHGIILMLYDEAVKQRHYMETTVDQRNLPALAEDTWNATLDDLQNRKRVWLFNYGHYGLDLNWPI